MIDGCSVRTVEGVSGPKNQLHPVQVSLIKSHGSQCCFCTPGFVISLYSGWLNNINWSIQNVENLLCGFYCRLALQFACPVLLVVSVKLVMVLAT